VLLFQPWVRLPMSLSEISFLVSTMFGFVSKLGELMATLLPLSHVFVSAKWFLLLISVSGSLFSLNYKVAKLRKKPGFSGTFRNRV
jgi:hypothetical protein